MNFQFAIIFGYGFEGDCAESLRLFENINELHSIVSEIKKEYKNCNYYKVGVIQPDGKVDYCEFVEI